jgi:hypothetical protein
LIKQPLISALRRLTRQGASRGYPEFQYSGSRLQAAKLAMAVRPDPEDTGLRMTPILRTVARSWPRNDCAETLQMASFGRIADEMRANDANLTQI